MKPMVHEPTLIPLSAIEPSPVQTRTRWGNLEELAKSIASVGLLQPVVVRPTGDNGSSYELVCGERRVRAARMIPWKEIPAIVRELTDEEAHEATALENLQREGLSPLEEARSINVLHTTAHSVEDIADRIGRSPAWVSKRIRLMALTCEWQKAIEDPENETMYDLPASVLELVARLNQDDQDKLYADILGWGTRTNAKELSRYIDGKFMRELDEAGFDVNDEALIDEVPACTKCLERTAAQPTLFDDLAGGEGLGRCLRVDCWMSKERASREKEYVAAKEKYGDELRTVAQGYYHGNSNESPWSKEIDRARIKNEWEWSSCKRSEPGAAPVLVIEGKDRGKVRWMKPNETARARKEREKKREKADPVGEADRKRMNVLTGLIAKAIRDRVSNDDIPKMNEAWLNAYLITLGLNTDTYTPDPWIEWGRKRDSGRPLNEQAKDVRRLILENIADDMENTFIVDGTAEISLICALCDLDFDALQAKALQEVPVPSAVAATPTEKPKKRRAKK